MAGKKITITCEYDLCDNQREFTEAELKYISARFCSLQCARKAVGGYSSKQKYFWAEEKIQILKAHYDGLPSTITMLVNIPALKGGDMYYITDKALKEFIVKYPEEVDLRRVDKFFFIDLLTNGVVIKNQMLNLKEQLA